MSIVIVGTFQGAVVGCAVSLTSASRGIYELRTCSALLSQEGG
jgi:gas vesicle protein